MLEIFKPMQTSNWWETIPDEELEEVLDRFDRVDWWTLTPEEERMAIQLTDEAARRYYNLRNHMVHDAAPGPSTPRILEDHPRPQKKRRLNRSNRVVSKGTRYGYH